MQFYQINLDYSRGLVSLIWVASVLFVAIVQFPSLLIAEDPFLMREDQFAQEKDPDGPDIGSDSSEPFSSSEILSENPNLGAEPAKKQRGLHLRKQQFPGYGSLRGELASFCKELIADGHYQRIKEILEKLMVEKADCVSCRQLYKALLCKSGPIRDAPSNKIPVLAPSTELLAWTSFIFNRISQNPDLSAVTAKNLDPVLSYLAEKKDPIADAYFSIFVAFIKAPLQSEFKKLDESKNEQQKKDKQKQLQEMF